MWRLLGSAACMVSRLDGTGACCATSRCPRGLLAFFQQRQGSLVVQDGAPNLVQVCWIHADCVVVATNDRSPKVRVLAVIDDGRGWV